MERDEAFMSVALDEAKAAFNKGEVPVGAVLVVQGKVIASAHNLVESLSDACAHAEILCMKKAASALGNWRLLGATLYTTLEPCSMCAGAMFLSRIETLVWGAPDLRHGANGSWVDLFATVHPTHKIVVRSGVMRQQCAQLMKSFFKMLRSADEGNV